MYFKLNLLISHYCKVHFEKKHLSLVRNRHSSVLSETALKWPYISLILYYLQVQFFFRYTKDLKYNDK